MTALFEYEYENIRFTCNQMGTRVGEYVINATRISDGRNLHKYVKQAFIKDEDAVNAGRSLEEHFLLACQARMLEALGNFEPEPTLCHACQAVLEPDHEDTDYQFDNCLWIDFLGGYSMFVDPIDRDYKVVICHECAHDLCEKVPWINTLLEPHNSHAHKTSYHEAHPEHWGWDYDKKV